MRAKLHIVYESLLSLDPYLLIDKALKLTDVTVDGHPHLSYSFFVLGPLSLRNFRATVKNHLIWIWIFFVFELEKAI